ncbi:MAG: hypothetical protein ABSG59_20020 [Verrucomicrobiota bacterium]
MDDMDQMDGRKGVAGHNGALTWLDPTALASAAAEALAGQGC